MTIGDRLKEVRQKAGLKQRDMAALFGLKLPGYNRIERDKVNLTLEHLITLKKEFGISFDWLITGEGVKSEIDGFGEFAVNIKQMLSDMEKDAGFMHGILSHYHQMKELKNRGHGKKELKLTEK
jgi:transcriptional regulator with XRE-family HTH domain